MLRETLEVKEVDYINDLSDFLWKWVYFDRFSFQELMKIIFTMLKKFNFWQTGWRKLLSFLNIFSLIKIHSKTLIRVTLDFIPDLLKIFFQLSNYILTDLAACYQIIKLVYFGVRINLSSHIFHWILDEPNFIWVKSQWAAVRWYCKIF